MKNWKTTVVGAGSAALMVGGTWLKGGDLTDYGSLLSALAVGLLGFLAKDAGVTGTKK